jgi:hypothetical protein
MNYLLTIKSGLLLIILTIDLGISSVRAQTNQKISQNQQYIDKQRTQLIKRSTSQELWEQFRQQQDQLRLQQQQRVEQFRVENQVKQQPLGQIRLDQLRQQQRQQMNILKQQQQLQKH